MNVQSALTALTSEHIEALMVANDPIALFQSRRIAEFAISKPIAHDISQRVMWKPGGLLSTARAFRDFNRRAAFYVDKIMRAQTATCRCSADALLPHHQPQTAEALGLSIPLELLVLATRSSNSAADCGARRAGLPCLRGSQPWSIAAAFT